MGQQDQRRQSLGQALGLTFSMLPQAPDPVRVPYAPAPERPAVPSLSTAFPRLASLGAQGLDLFLGALGVGPNTKANQVGATLAAMAPLAGPARRLASSAKTAAAESLGAARGIKAYHGSPHDFEQFSLSKVGTGEGASAYGHGLYFADAEGVAQEYRKQLSGAEHLTVRVGNQKLQNEAIDDIGLEAVKYLEIADDTMHDRPHLRAWQAKRDAASAPVPKGQDPAAYRAAIQKRIDEWADARIGYERNPGRVYEVNIKADPEQLLDWDKPLKDQPEHVRQAMERVATELSPDMLARWKESGAWNDAPAGSLYRGLTRGGDQAALSSELHDAGVPGIRYLDQASRPKNATDHALHALVSKHGGNVEAAVDDMGRGVYLPPKEKAQWRRTMIESYKPATSNYVVFDDKLIEVLRKYGIMLPLAGAAAVGGGIGAQPRRVQ